MVGDELPWKITLGHDAVTQQFTLGINGVPFYQLEFQQELERTGPENIEKGQIKINGVLITPRENFGFMMFDWETLPSLLKEHQLNKQQINHVFIGGMFRCSSTEVVNSIFDQIGQFVDNDDQGLASLEIKSY